MNTGLNIPSGWMFEDPFDNLATVAELEVPYLITHGSEDTYIMPEHGKRVFDAANEPKELYYVPGAAHGGSHLDAPDEYAGRGGRLAQRVSLSRDKALLCPHLQASSPWARPV